MNTNEPQCGTKNEERGTKNFRPPVPLRTGHWALIAVFISSFMLHPSCFGYPPAPHHVIYGLVRDELGHPLQVNNAVLYLTTDTGITNSTPIRLTGRAAENYRLVVPLDSGVTDGTYHGNALNPTLPFRIRVVIGKTSYLPIEVAGTQLQMGDPAEETRLDLTLGEDADGDGIPDAWERALIASLRGGHSLADIQPGGDADGDGLTNLQEYLLGTYAYDPQDGFTLGIRGVTNGLPVLEFTAISGRTYAVQGSTNLQSWMIVPFRLLTDSPQIPSRAHLQATNTQILRVDVPPLPTGTVPGFFKLLVH